MLKLKLQYFGHLVQRTDSLEKTLMLGKIEGKRRRGWQRIRWLDNITNSMDTNFSNFQETEEPGGLYLCYMVGSYLLSILYIVVVLQLLSCVRLFATPWTVARQASLSFTISQSLLKLISMMPSNHFIVSFPFVFNLSQNQGLFQ